MYNSRLEENMSQLTQLLFSLYGHRWDFYKVLDKLEKIMRQAAEVSDDAFSSCASSDSKSACEYDSSWINDQKTVGMVLYVDLFSGNLKELINKIPYFLELGVNYIHLMPLFDCPKDNNDGGYAISSYRKVQPSLGTIEDLKEVAKAFHKENIRLVLDFVFNHTSDEHEWALKARKGDPKYKDYYYIIKNKNEVDEWNRTLREIFPTFRRGSFTWQKDMKAWVWTTFNSFQWDLNYSNPQTFLAMCEEMLAIANLGVDVLRLDALAFVWKEKGTACESLPKAHTLIKAFQYVAKIACPRLIFKSEAIVHPNQVVQYIHEDECKLSYNPLQMALFWSTIATRDTRLLTLSLKRNWKIPEGTAWVNYIRCHDDIGWTFRDEDAAEFGINGYMHRQFLNKFFTGRFPGTYACGEPFQLNPATGDCRICGPMASLAGLEQAESLKSPLLRKMAVGRIKMMFATLLALPGIPLIYFNDERAVFNDYSYRNIKGKKDDSRWVHRIKTDWEKPFEHKSQKEIFDFVKKAISIRKKEKNFGENDFYIYDIQNPQTFIFKRGMVHVAVNFSDQPAPYKIDAWSPESKDLLSGKKYWNYSVQMLEPYEVRWLKEIIKK